MLLNNSLGIVFSFIIDISDLKYSNKKINRKLFILI